MDSLHARAPASCSVPPPILHSDYDKTVRRVQSVVDIYTHDAAECRSGTGALYTGHVVVRCYCCCYCNCYCYCYCYYCYYYYYYYTTAATAPASASTTTATAATTTTTTTTTASTATVATTTTPLLPRLLPPPLWLRGLPPRLRRLLPLPRRLQID